MLKKNIWKSKGKGGGVCKNLKGDEGGVCKVSKGDGGRGVQEKYLELKGG